MQTPPEGNSPKYQFIGNSLHGGQTFNGNVVIYKNRPDLPRRLTALPSLHTKLIGRTADLEQLSASLTTNQTVALVRGMGGVGKTTLATAYLQANVSDLAHTVWISQTTDFATSLLATDNLPTTLGIPITDNPTDDAQNLLRELSRLAGPSLLVIDNAEADLNDFLPYLPGAPNWKVLITARKTLRVPINLQLDNLEAKDAIALFRNHYTFQDDETIIRSIVTDVGGHALTIELLAKTAEKLNLSLQHFYDTLKERGLAINRRANINVEHAGTMEVEKVFPYLLAIFEMSNLPEDAQRLLYQFTILPTDFISFDRLQTIFQLDPDHEEEWDNFSQSLDFLTKSGWLTYNTDQGYRIHQVIQDIVSHNVHSGSSPQDLDKALAGTTKLISFDQHQDNPATMLNELAFGESVLKKLSNYPHNNIYSFFIDRLATLLAIFDRYKEACKHFENALEIDIATLGEKHINVQLRRTNLGNTYTSLGRYSKAARLHETALKHALESRDNDHPTIQLIRTNLAIAYGHLGQHDREALLLEESLKYSIIQNGEDHPSVQQTRYNLALHYRDIKEYRTAENLLQVALHHLKNKLGDHHVDVERVRSALGMNYSYLGDDLKAEDLLKTSIHYQSVNLGDDNQLVQSSRSNLGIVYGKMGRYQEAESLLLVALKHGIKNLGSSHPEVQTTKNNLAMNYYKQEKYEESLNLLLEVHANRMIHFGPNHPIVIATQSNIIAVQQALENPSIIQAPSFWDKIIGLVTGSKRQN